MALGDALLREGSTATHAGLVFEGEPGIGRTAVFDAIVRRARAAGWSVLVARPAEAELDLPFATLGDLVGPGPWSLGAPFERVLAAALQQAEPISPLDRVAIGRTLLRLLERTGPTLLAIDDLQWVDEPTATGLTFAIRRLPEHVRMLATRRPIDIASADAPLARIEFPPGRTLTTHVLDPISLAALDRLIVHQLGKRLSRPRLTELHQLSHGNPLLAIEIGRCAGDDLVADAPLSVPHDIAAVLGARLSGLTDAARDALIVSALAQDRSIRNLERALGGLAGLTEAVHAGVLVVEGDDGRPAHPLLGSIATAQLAPWELREIHARLADDASPSVRAHHLARAHDRPDEGIAATLEAAARSARHRGAPATGAGLADASVRLTPATDGTSCAVRRCLAAELHLVAGDPMRARLAVEPLLAATTPPPWRARALLLMADATGDDIGRSLELARSALDAAGDDERVLAECHGLLEVLTWLAGDVDASARHCAAAVEHAEASGDQALLASALAEQCHLEVLLGRPLDEAALNRALDLEQSLGAEATYAARPSMVAAIVRMMRDELGDARRLLESEAARVVSIGDDLGRLDVLFRTVELELREGRWDGAVRHCEELRDLARQAGTEQEETLALQMMATTLAHLGRVDAARAAGEAALAITRASGDRSVETRTRGALGFLALSQGDAGIAAELLDPAVEHLVTAGIGELSIHHVAQNALEAHALLGHLEHATELADWIERSGEPTGRTWHRGVALRGRALIAASAGDLTAALAFAERAVDAHADLAQPFERARTYLVRGEIERRVKRRAQARDSLSIALSAFTTVGASVWAKRASDELARVTRRPADDQSDILSETERRVAMLAATGRTNKEISAELFVTVRTVEANLTKVYGKLGVRSRTELANRLA